MRQVRILAESELLWQSTCHKSYSTCRTPQKAPFCTLLIISGLWIMCQHGCEAAGYVPARTMKMTAFIGFRIANLWAPSCFLDRCQRIKIIRQCLPLSVNWMAPKR